VSLSTWTGFGSVIYSNAFTREGGGFFHDGRFATLSDVGDH
jgi:hypothetical protein